MNNNIFRCKLWIYTVSFFGHREVERAAEIESKLEQLYIPFEDSLSKEQIEVFHKILDCVSDTVAAEIRAALRFLVLLSYVDVQKYNDFQKLKFISNHIEIFPN